MGLNASASSINVAQARPLGGTGGPVPLSSNLELRSRCEFTGGRHRALSL